MLSGCLDHVLDEPDAAVEEPSAIVVAQAHELVPLERVGTAEAATLTQAGIDVAARDVATDENLVAGDLTHVTEGDHSALAVVAKRELLALAHGGRHPDDGIVARLAMNLRQHDVRLAGREEPAAIYWWQLRFYGYGDHRHVE